MDSLHLHGVTLSYSQKLADLEQALLTGVAVFYYKKKAKEGEEPVVRRAIGTLQSNLLPSYKTAHVEALLNTAQTLCNDLVMAIQTPALLQDVEPIEGRIAQFNDAVAPFLPTVGKTRKVNESKQNYFDLEAGDWRSFDKDGFMAVLK